MAGNQTILSVENVRVRFRTLDGFVEAVKGVNLHVDAGETVAGPFNLGTNIGTRRR